MQTKRQLEWTKCQYVSVSKKEDRRGQAYDSIHAEPLKCKRKQSSTTSCNSLSSSPGLMNTPPPCFSKEGSWGQQELCNKLSRVSAEQSPTCTDDWELPFSPHVSLISTTMLRIDKHPANKRPVVPDMMMMRVMTFFSFWCPANILQEMSPSKLFSQTSPGSTYFFITTHQTQKNPEFQISWW